MTEFRFKGPGWGMGSQRGLTGLSLSPWASVPCSYTLYDLDMSTVPTQPGDTRSCQCGLGVSPSLPGLVLSTYTPTCF